MQKKSNAKEESKRGYTEYDYEPETPALRRAWALSKVNAMQTETITKNNLYLWAFGENSKGMRALSVQIKKDVIDLPEVAYVPDVNKLGDEIGNVIKIVTG